LRVARDGKRIGFSPSRDELAIAELAPPAVFRPWLKANAADEEVYGMALSPDGAVLATAGEGGIHLWDTESAVETSVQPLQTRNDRVPQTFWLWPGGDPAHARKLAENFPMMGYRLAAGGRWGITTDALLSDLWVWDPQTGRRVRNLNIPLGVVSQVSHDGRW